MQRRIRGSGRAIALGVSAVCLAIASCSRLPVRDPATMPAPVPAVDVSANGVSFAATNGRWEISAAGWNACGERSDFERRAAMQARGLARFELVDPRQPRAGVQEWYATGQAPYLHGVTIRRLPSCHTGDRLTVWLESTLPLQRDPQESHAYQALAGEQVIAHYRGLQVFDADGNAVAFGLQQVAPSELALELDLTGAVFPLTIDPWIELTGVGAVALPGPAGEAVALSADDRWLAVAEPAEHGAVVGIKTRDDAGGWTAVQRIAAPRAARHMRFGARLAFAGQSLAVAALPDGGAAESALVFIYRPDRNGHWELRQTLEAADRSGAGHEAVLTGDCHWLAVAAPPREWQAEAVVDLYAAGPNGVLPRTSLVGPRPAEPDGFARALTVSDGQLFVGAPLTHAGAPHAGRVHVYALDDGRPQLVGQIEPPAPQLRGQFGTHLASNARWLVVGGAGDQLFVYAREAGGWLWIGEVAVAGEVDAIAVQGDRLIVRSGGDETTVAMVDLATLQPVAVDAVQTDGVRHSPLAAALASTRAASDLAADDIPQAKGTPVPAVALDLLVPGEAAVLAERRPELTFEYRARSAIDTASLRWTIAGQPVAFHCDRQRPVQPREGRLQCRPDGELANGQQTWQFTIRTRGGEVSPVLSRTVTIGSVAPPPAIAAGAVQLTALADGWRLAVDAAAIAAGAELVARTQGLTDWIAGQPDAAAWTVDVPAAPGDTLLVAARNAAGTSAPLLLTPGLPASPTEAAPPLVDGGAAGSGPAAEFLIAGPDPIQRDADPGAFEAERSAVVRGKLVDRDGGALPGVHVAVVGHDEYGYTLSRDDGEFDLMVNGGGVLLLEFRKSGYLFAQRQAQVPWRDFVVLDDVALVALDPAVSVIQTGAAVPQLAVGSVSEDASGARQPAVYFPPGTQASMVLADGSLQPLAQLDVRMTEYTVGANGEAAMPAPLPPTTAYTYAVELSVDQALQQGSKIDGRDVVFDRPVAFYVDNFMAFPVGEGVPTGYYDNTAAEWKAVDDGRVIGMLQIVDGLAVLDLDGSGIAADATALAQLGIDDDERRMLAQRFAAGQTFWRAQMTHFSTWDCNWPFGLPLDIVGHFVELLMDAVKSGNEADECGCLIGTTTRDLGEKTAIPGVPGFMRYDSLRMFKGNYRPTITLTLTPEAIPDSMKRVELELYFLGRKHAFSFAATKNLRTRVPLVLLDPYYREREGSYPLKVRVGYVYQPLIRGAGGAGGGGGGGGQPRSFGSAGALPITGDRERMEIIDWWEDTDQLTFLSATSQRETGGWQLSAQHQLDVSSGTLMLGDGRTVAMNQRPETLRTVAGSGGEGNAAEGAPAVGYSLKAPRALAVDARGRMFIADTGNHRVRRVDPDGRIFTVAGLGAPGHGGDGGPASSALLHTPSALAFDEEGRLYIADSGNHRIRRIDTDGTITTIAGTGTPGRASDGALPAAAPLDSPRGIATNRFGYVFIADTGNDLVWAIQPDGRLLRLAGGGSGEGEGSRALDVALSEPEQLAADEFGNLYVAEVGTGRVRLVRPDGLVFTAAGGGTDPAANNVAATAARLDPTGLGLDYAQRLLIADGSHHRIRRVDGNGAITTVAGTGGAGYAADSLPASRVPIEAPRAIALDRSGRMLFAHYHAIRRIGHQRNPASGGEIPVADPSGETLHVFDTQGRHLRTLDGLTGGLLYRLEYANGVLTGMVDAFGNTTTVERDATGQPTGLRSPDGQRTGFTLDTRGYLASTVTPEGHTTEFGYSTDGLLQWMRTPRGQRWDYVYTADGQLAQDNRPDGSGWTIRATEFGSGRETAFESRLGRVTTYGVINRPDGTEVRYRRAADGAESYREIRPGGDAIALYADGSATATATVPHPRFGTQAMLPGRSVIETPSGLRSEITHSYSAEPAGASAPADLQRWTETTNVNGRAFVLAFDAASRTFESRTPMGRSAAMQVDAQRRPLSLQVPGLADLDYHYDARGRLEAVRQSDGTQTREYRFGYDANGYLASVTDPLERTVGIHNDRDGRPTRLTLPDLREIALDVDASGNVTALTTPQGPVHRFGYDPLDRETRYEAPAIGSTPTVSTTTFDADGNPARQDLPGGIALNFSYDAYGRLNNVSRPSQAGDHGNEVKLDYEYDGFLTTAETSSGAVNGEVRYGYDDEFRLNRIEAPGATTHYAFDDDGLLVGATTEDTTGAGSAPVELTLQRDPDNGLLLGTQAGIVSDRWEWNAFGEPIRYEARAGTDTLFVQAFERDRLGRITKKTETVLGETTVYGYAYDLAGRLEQVWINGFLDESYTYDRNGNRKTLTRDGVTTVYEYDAQDRLLSQGDCTYTYTANGELETQTCGGETTRYTYSVHGDLTAVSLPDGKFIEYVVDGRGRRIGKKVGGRLVQHLVYANQLNPVAEIATDGEHSTFQYGERSHVPSVIARDGVTYRLISDHLGSARALVNIDTGEVVQQMAYSAWGEVSVSGDPSIQPFGYAGGVNDTITGFTRFGARDYDAAVGRWTSKDPIGFGGGSVGLFAYVNGDPINWIDPSGLAPCEDDLGLSDFAELVPGYDLAACAVSGCDGLDWTLAVAGIVPVSKVFKVAKIIAKAARKTTVIGRMDDIRKLRPGEQSLKSPIDRLPDRGNPRDNWRQNAGALRQEMRRNQPIRDASPGDTGGQFLNAERNLLQSRGWTYDAETSFWMPPKP